MLIVPMDTAGVEIVRNISVRWRADREGSEAYLRMVNARVPRENLLGEPGEAFAIAQTRLGGGRIHHAMRTVGSVKPAFDLMCERAGSRPTNAEQLARKQLCREISAAQWV